MKLPAEISKSVADFLTKISQPAVEVSGIVGDSLRYVRWKNSLDILEKAKNISAAKGIEPSKVPTKFLIPFLEESSLEDDDGLKNMWAALLANSSGNFSDKHKLYKDILSELSFDEAKFISDLRDELWTIPSPMTEALTGRTLRKAGRQAIGEVMDKFCRDMRIDESPPEIHVEEILSKIEPFILGPGSRLVFASLYGPNDEVEVIAGRDEDDWLFSLQHLQKMGLVETDTYEFDSADKFVQPIPLTFTVRVVKITPFGVDFVVACTA